MTMTEEEKKEKELPPIEDVFLTEAEFKETKSGPAWEWLKEEKKIEEKKEDPNLGAFYLTKENVKLWWETSIIRGITWLPR